MSRNTLAVRNTLQPTENNLKFKAKQDAASKGTTTTTTTATATAKGTKREALSNLTNAPTANVARATKPQTKAKPQNKATKRPVDTETDTEAPCEPEQKRRKSTEAMVIDEAPATATSTSMIMDDAPEWENIDATDFDDPQAVVEFVNDIYECLMAKERADPVSPRYMSNQADVNEKMRAILIDWLVEVHRMFKLLPETLFMTVNVIDRFLEKKSVSRDQLQLVGITAMFIGSKYEEIYAPECNDFVYIADGAYTKEQILAMETDILNTLNFNLTTPSALHFLRRYSKAAGSDYTIHTLCKYIIELCLIDIKLLRFVPSEIAAGSVYLARMMTKKGPLWTATLQHYSTYNEEHVRSVAVEINALMKRAQNSALKAVQKKYAHERHGQVSELALADL